MNYRLGLDTGGTYTDAIMLDERSDVVATAKSLTTHHDLSIGLRGAISAVMASEQLVDDAKISLVSLSTTLATNALVEGRGRPVCLVLIGYTESQLKRARLVEALDGDPMGFIDGGHDAAGHATQDLDVAELETLINSTQARVEAFAVSSIFSVRNPEHEIKAREIIRSLTGKPVSCGHELSSGLDAPRRALTAVLNARLIPLIKGLLDATDGILKEYSISSPLMVVKGDGSLVNAVIAQDCPVETILSGPAASVVGAQFLSGESNLIVSDMGGTTTDVALLKNGMPKLDPSGATVGGWRTMVNAVMISTCGLGGDSAILFNREQRDFSIGPHRVKSLALLVNEYPKLIRVLEEQLEFPYTSTHGAQFALRNSQLGENVTLTGQQRELWDKLSDGPVSLVDMFEYQTLDRALTRLIARGLVLIAGFTPTDAAHVLGKQSDWDNQASSLGAELLMRYSDFNLGPGFDSVEAFARYIHEKVSRESAMNLIETTLADHLNVPGQMLHPGERRFINRSFAPPGDVPVSIAVKLHMPVMGIGAPAVSYYPRVAELLSTSLELPEHGRVANALGAVVGSVRQSLSMTITPAGGVRVRVHAESGPREFDKLELAVDWAVEDLKVKVSQQVVDAGAAEFGLSVEQQDNIVEHEGRKVFFESVVTVHATGRPATVEQLSALASKPAADPATDQTIGSET